jgi:hypothetical protein
VRRRAFQRRRVRDERGGLFDSPRVTGDSPRDGRPLAPEVAREEGREDSPGRAAGAGCADVAHDENALGGGLPKEETFGAIVDVEVRAPAAGQRSGL